MPGMREMRGRGAVAVCVAAAVVVLSGCGGGSGDDGKGKAPSSSPPVTESSPDVPVESTPAYPPGPEGEIDQKADEMGWVYDDSTYDSASAFVQDICDSLPVSGVDGASRPQWLVESGMMADDGKAILGFGVPKLCAKWSKTVRQAASGDYPRWITSGDYEVKAHPKPFDPAGDSDVQEIGPGTYEARGDFKDCYWERTSQSGDILENKFVTQARVLRVSLRAGELFKNECGTFKPVG